MTGPLKLDLHVHSTHSPDSRFRLSDIVARLGEVGLDGFALTDHNTIAGHAELAALAARYPRLRLIPGVEVTTAAGHLLALGVTELPPHGAPLGETCRWIDAHGGVPVPSHPFRRVHGIGRRAAESAPVPALETVNGHNTEVANGRAELLAAKRGLGATGGSDAHDPEDLGRAFTELPEGVNSLPEILEAIRTHRSRGAGRSLTPALRARLLVRNSLQRAARGFRAP